VRDESTVLLGGFGICGIPENLIEGLVRKGATNLTVVTNNSGQPDWGVGRLVRRRLVSSALCLSPLENYFHPWQVKKLIAAYIGDNAEVERQYLSGDLEVEITPQVRCFAQQPGNHVADEYLGKFGRKTASCFSRHSSVFHENRNGHLDRNWRHSAKISTWWERSGNIFGAKRNQKIQRCWVHARKGIVCRFCFNQSMESWYTRKPYVQVNYFYSVLRTFGDY